VLCVQIHYANPAEQPLCHGKIGPFLTVFPLTPIHFGKLLPFAKGQLGNLCHFRFWILEGGWSARAGSFEGAGRKNQ
jgi:hypothetical protein